MTAQKQREIVIEFEKVQLIRKRASTSLRHCGGCGAATDAVSLIEAAALFETAPADLLQFIKQNACHHYVGFNGKIFLCVVSLLESMNQKNKIRLSLAEGK
jgi:hypothetical protein